MSDELADDGAVVRDPESHTQPHLTTLPDEVLQQILTFLPPLTTLSLQRTCRRFVHTASEPLLWKQYCGQFRWWNKRHSMKLLLDSSFTDWKTLYASRYNSSRIIRKHISTLVTTEIGRLDVIQQILDEGEDARGELLNLYWNAASSPNHLAQKYWTFAALGCLNRFEAVDTWMDIKHELDRDAPGIEASDFERPLAALDLFVLEAREQGNVDDIYERLDSYVSSVRNAHPDIDDMSPQAKASVIAAHLLQNNWVGIQGNRHYHSLDHMFLGIALFSDNRNSVPLISAVIYCYVARHFGLRATPCSYPYHVHALIQPPTGFDLNGNPLPDSFHHNKPHELTHLYMDPFNSSEPISYSTLATRARFVAPHSSLAQIDSYVSPSSPVDLLIRASHNILAVPSQYQGSPVFHVNASLASYAALCALAVFSPGRLRNHITILTRHFFEHFDLDVRLFETFILPMTSQFPDAEAYRNLLYEIKETDHQTYPPKYRSHPRHKDVKYRVGQVFRHRMRGYHGVIYGWDAYCGMHEDWITANGVDGLSKGRHQPFYNVLVNDKSMRYVAEENVIVLSAEHLTDQVLNSFDVEIGKWFKRYDPATGTFVSNIRNRYPED